MKALVDMRGDERLVGANAANAADWVSAPKSCDLGGVSTGRISLTSAAVCVGILAWVLVNAYLAQV